MDPTFNTQHLVFHSWFSQYSLSIIVNISLNRVFHKAAFKNFGENIILIFILLTVLLILCLRVLDQSLGSEDVLSCFLPKVLYFTFKYSQTTYLFCCFEGNLIERESHLLKMHLFQMYNLMRFDKCGWHVTTA